MALIRAGRASLDKPGHVDRYTVHVVADMSTLLVGVGRSELLDGSPIAIETLRRISCDCGIVRHVLKGNSEHLDIGTRTPVWTTAQRRAIQVRDHGHCRWPGCWRRTCDCHHIIPAPTVGRRRCTTGACCALSTTRARTRADSVSAATRMAP